jgi:hypothetical protein
LVHTVGARYRSAKQCLEILDELFGRDRRSSDQILDQFDVLGRKGAGRAELALATRCATSQSGMPRAFMPCSARSGVIPT